MAKTPKENGITLSLPQINFKSLETVALAYHAVIPPGHTRQNLESRDYWCHVARRLKMHSRIEFVAHDFSFAGTAIVRSVGDTWANVWIIAYVEWDEKSASDVDLSLYKIDNTAEGFRVIHKPTGEVVAKSIATRREAMDLIEGQLARK